MFKKLKTIFVITAILMGAALVSAQTSSPPNGTITVDNDIVNLNVDFTGQVSYIWVFPKDAPVTLYLTVWATAEVDTHVVPAGVAWPLYTPSRVIQNMQVVSSDSTDLTINFRETF